MTKKENLIFRALLTCLNHIGGILYSQRRATDDTSEKVYYTEQIEEIQNLFKEIYALVYDPDPIQKTIKRRTR